VRQQHSLKKLSFIALIEIDKIRLERAKHSVKQTKEIL
jgi:hypothetical protein